MIDKRAYTPEDKRKVLDGLLEVWLQFPDLRLGQLISCVADVQCDADLFYIEDSLLIEAAKEFAKDSASQDPLKYRLPSRS